MSNYTGSPAKPVFDQYDPVMTLNDSPLEFVESGSSFVSVLMAQFETYGKKFHEFYDWCCKNPLLLKDKEQSYQMHIESEVLGGEPISFAGPNEADNFKQSKPKVKKVMAPAWFESRLSQEDKPNLDDVLNDVEATSNLRKRKPEKRVVHREISEERDNSPDRRDRVVDRPRMMVPANPPQLSLVTSISILLNFIYLRIESTHLGEAINEAYRCEGFLTFFFYLFPEAQGIYNQRPTLETFIELVQSDLEGNHRKDENQKRAYSKFCSTLYNEVKSKKITKDAALEKLAKIYELEGDEVKSYNPFTNSDIFERIFGDDRKSGLKNEVVNEFLNNPVFWQKFNYKFLSEIVALLNKQSRSDLNRLLGKLSTSSLAEILIDMRNEDGKKRRSFKLPWTKAQNIESMIDFLGKIKFRADKEQTQNPGLSKQSSHLIGLIKKFEQDLQEL